MTLEVYAIGNRTDEAFALAAEMLAKNPDDIHVLMRMTQAGTKEARNKNRKYTDISLQYGLKAIALLEANKKPASINDECGRCSAVIWTNSTSKRPFSISPQEIHRRPERV